MFSFSLVFGLAHLAPALAQTLTSEGVELDGNVVSDSRFDWANKYLNTGTDPFVSTTGFIADTVPRDATDDSYPCLTETGCVESFQLATTFTGQTKDNLPISSWLFRDGTPNANVQDKDDIQFTSGATYKPLVCPSGTAVEGGQCTSDPALPCY